MGSAKVWGPHRVYSMYCPLCKGETIHEIVNNYLLKRPGDVNLKDFKWTDLPNTRGSQTFVPHCI